MPVSSGTQLVCEGVRIHRPLERSPGGESHHQETSPQCHWGFGTPLLSHLCYFIGSNDKNKARISNAANQEETQDQSHCVQGVPCPDTTRMTVLLYKTPSNKFILHALLYFYLLTSKDGLILHLLLRDTEP